MLSAFPPAPATTTVATAANAVVSKKHFHIDGKPQEADTSDLTPF